ncbi:MAG TPA: hypothetical protein VKT51_11975 [Candidatus Eremiobacteraceae bacterium]|nr:hypothetical protein [Candidatus Eremiobacteraceae bacterium]
MKKSRASAVAVFFAAACFFYAHPVGAATQDSRDPRAAASLVLSPTYDPLGDRHIATSMGIPLFVTHDVTEALRQPMVIVAGELSGDEMTASVEAAMRAYANGGGTLIINDPESMGAQDLAGIKPTIASQKRYELHFDVSSGDPGLAHLRAWQSQTIEIGNPKENTADVTQSVTPIAGSGARIIAHFDDGSGAITVRPIGRGRVIALGAALYDLVVIPQNNHAPDSFRWYDNHFEPSADSPQYVVRDWYLAYVRGAVTLDTVPDGMTGALIFTHDVDYSLSIINMVAYAKAEHAHGIRATYFIQTKNVNDQADSAFFDATGKANTVQVFSLGGDIASHTVAHARDFSQYPFGTGTETPSNYHPKVVAGGSKVVKGRTLGGSLLGEMLVSKALLDGAASGIAVDAFRSGYLYIHPRQFEALTRSGYRFDSSYTAGNLLTVFPFRHLADGSYDHESAVTEFPILITDSKVPMLPLVTDFNKVLDDEAVLHGVCVVLIHPDVVADKLPTELALYAHVKGRFWVGDLDSFGNFWLNRSRVQIATSFNGDAETVRVTAPAAISGLTLDTPGAVRVASATGTTAVATPSGTSIVLGSLASGQTATVVLEPLKQAAASGDILQRRLVPADSFTMGPNL